MNAPFKESKQKNIPIREAANSSGYSTGYLSNLCRTGKVIGKYSHNEWLVDTASLERFSKAQAERKEARARSLAHARSREYYTRSTKELTTPSTTTAEPLGLVRDSFRSQGMAFVVAVLVVTSGAFVAHAGFISELADTTAMSARETASGFKATFGDIPSRIASRIVGAENEMRMSSSRVAVSNAIPSADFAQPLLAEPNLSYLHMALDDDYRAPRSAFARGGLTAPLSVQTKPILTVDELQSFIFAAYALGTNPPLATSAFINEYDVMGASAYDAISTALSDYRSLIERLGEQTLAFAITTRTTLTGMPAFVTRVNLAFGNAIIDVTHAAIRADVSVSYGLAAAAPESARATVAFLGSTGDALARATSRVPALATALFLHATEMPTHAGPALAQAVFDAEYVVADRFVAIALAALPDEVTLPQLPGSPDFPNMLARISAMFEDAYLGTLGTIALRWEGEIFENNALAAVVSALSPIEHIALATYETIQDFFNSASNALAFLFTPPPQIVLVQNTPPTPLPATTTSTRSQTSNATPRSLTSNTYPTYVTNVKGISEDFMNQSLAGLRADILATVSGLIRPVSNQVATNATTIQQVNMIQKLADLIVTNGDFRGGSLTGGSLVSATTGTFTTLTGGTTALGATTVTGDLAVSGTLTPAVVSAGTSISAPYFIATSTTATSTFAGSLNVDNGALVYATTTRNVGIGTTSPATTLSVHGNQYTSGTAFFGGALTATSTFTSTATATSTFAGRLAVGTTTPYGDGFFTVGTSTPLLHISSNTGNVGIGALASTYRLDLNGTLRAVGDAYFNSHISLGDATTTDITYFNSRIADSLVPTADNALDLGDGANWLRWRTGYFGTSVGVGGTATSTGINLLASGAYAIDSGSTLSINTTNNQPVSFGTGTVTLPFASSTALSIASGLWVGGNATTSSSGDFTTNGNLVVRGTVNDIAGTLNLSGGLLAATAGLSLTSGGAGNLVLDAGSGSINIASGDDILAVGTNSNIGSIGIKFNTLYVDTVSATTLVGVVVGGATNAADWIINTDNASDDTEPMTLAFERGTVVPNALLTWNSAENAKRFEFNQPLYIQNASASTTLVTLDLKSVAGQTANIFRIASSSGDYLLNFTAAGNLGLGTTSPYARLSVVGPIIAEYFHATSTTATSTFAGGFVVGQCVTGDTLIRVRRRRKGGRYKDDETAGPDDYGDDHLTIRITDIEPGDEVLSLNPETGKFEYHRIKGLLDTGMNEVFKIRTSSGRYIETTANHPYLTRARSARAGKHGSRIKVAIDYANIKAWLLQKGLTMDMDILSHALFKSGANDVRFYYGTDTRNLSANSFFNKLQRFGYAVITKPVSYFKVSLLSILSRDSNKRWLEECATDLRTQLLTEAGRLDAAGVELHEPKANFDIEIATDALDALDKYDTFVLFSGDGDFVPLVEKLKENGKRTVVISGHKNFSALLRESASAAANMELIAQIVPGLLVPFDRQKPAHEGRVFKKCEVSIASVHRLSSLLSPSVDKSCAPHTTTDIRRRRWVPVRELSEGQEIAVMTSEMSVQDFGKQIGLYQELVFEEIVSIENTGTKQTYDIEVEGTHNFVAGHLINTKTVEPLTSEEEEKVLQENWHDVENMKFNNWGTPSEYTTTEDSVVFGGIVAHNTAFLVDGATHNVGIASTSPSATLSVNGTGYFSGTGFFGGAITATSTLNVTGLTTLGNASTTQIGSTGSAYFATSGGNVGIASTSPSATLSVNGTGYFSGTGFFGGAITATSTLTVSGTGNSSFVGNVGIGTTSPASLLSVHGAGYVSSSLFVGGALTATSSITANSLSLTTALPVSSGGTGNSTFTSSQLLYGNSTSALASVATTSLAFSGPFIGASSLGALVGGANATVTWTGLATTSQPASSNLLVSNGAAGVYGVATSSLTATGLLSISNSPAILGSSGAVVTLPLTKGNFVVGNDAGIAQATSSIFISSTGSVGIGTTSPYAQLSIATPAGATGSLSTLFAIASSTGGTSTSTLMAVLANGNVGIGTASPATALYILGNGTNPIETIATTLSTGVSGLNLSFNNGTNIPKAQFTFNTGTGEVRIGSAAENYFPTFYSNASEAMRITTAGNVGIGTTTPNSILNIAGATPKLTITNTSGSLNQKHWFIQNSGGEFLIGTTSDALVDTALAAVKITAAGALSNPGVGSNSERFGSGSTASGNDSLSVGNGATASGIESTAIGKGATASGADSVAIGRTATASGGAAVAIGAFNTNASTDGVAIGSAANATTEGVAIGTNAKAIGNVGSIAIGGYASTTAAHQIVIGGRQSNGTNATDMYLGGGVVDTTAASFTIHATGGSGADVAGGNLTIAGGQSTGSALGGSLIFQTAAAGGSGSSLNALSTRMTITSAGSVGIGTTTPASLLSVHGNSYISGTSFFGGALTATSTLTLSALGTPAGTLLAANANGQLIATSTIGVSNLALAKGNFLVGNDAGTAQATSSIFISSTGSVGIGTTNPQTKLDVQGTASSTLYYANNGSLTTPAYSFPGSTNSGIYMQTSPVHQLAFASNGTKWLTVDGNGVGIGLPAATNAGAQFEIYGNSPTGHVAQKFSSGASGVGSRIWFTDSSSYNYAFGAADNTNGDLVWEAGGQSGVLGTERMRITQGGNLGIGTTSPSALLAVHGNSYVSGTGFFGGAITGTSTLNITGLTTLVNASTTQLSVSNTAYFPGSGIWNSSGNVGIGTTSPWGKLSVTGAGTGTGIGFLVADSANSPKMVVLDNGNVGIGTTSPYKALSVVGGVTFPNLETNTDNAGYQVVIKKTDGTLMTDNSLVVNPAEDEVTIGNLSLFTSGTVRANNVALSLATNYFNPGIIVTTGGSNKIIIGDTTDRTIGTANRFQIPGTSAANSSLGFSMWSADALSSRIEFGKSRGAAIGTNTIVQNNDVLGTIAGYGANGTDFTNAASIFMEVDGTPGASADMPGRLTFYTTPDGSGTALERMRIDNAGNVGIGTTSPVSKLSVVGESAFAGGASVGIGYAGTAAPSNGLIIQGNVGIGLTEPTQRLHVIRSGSGIVARFSDNTTQTLDIGITTSGGAYYDNPNSGYQAWQIGGAEKMRLSTTGNVGIGTTSPATLFEVGGTTRNITFDGYLNCTAYTSNANGLLDCTSSDERVKQNIAPIATSSALAGINALNPVSFNWRNASQGTEQQFGLIAQEVESVFPNLVQMTNPTVLTPDGTLTVNYYGLIAPMVRSIQELDARTRQILGSDGVLSLVPGVESQCVTGDTKLRRRKKKDKNEPQSRHGDAEYDEIAIADVAEGDEIQSLDEHTGQVVYSRVNALIDMGEQEVYELVTRSGRRIRTTANHPFLARIRMS